MVAAVAVGTQTCPRADSTDAHRSLMLLGQKYYSSSFPRDACRGQQVSAPVLFRLVQESEPMSL